MAVEEDMYAVSKEGGPPKAAPKPRARGAAVSDSANALGGPL